MTQLLQYKLLAISEQKNKQIIKNICTFFFYLDSLRIFCKCSGTLCFFYLLLPSPSMSKPSIKMVIGTGL